MRAKRTRTPRETRRALRQRGTTTVEMVVLFVCIAVAGIGGLFYLGQQIRLVISG